METELDALKARIAFECAQGPLVGHMGVRELATLMGLTYHGLRYFDKSVHPIQRSYKSCVSLDTALEAVDAYHKWATSDSKYGRKRAPNHSSSNRPVE